MNLLRGWCVYYRQDVSVGAGRQVGADDVGRWRTVMINFVEKRLTAPLRTREMDANAFVVCP